MMFSNSTDFYLSMQKFADMKLDAKNRPDEATQAVAQQFESLFMQQMLGAMRSAAIVDESQHSSYVDFYQDMYDKQLSLNLSRQGGLGIADLLVRQLNGRQGGNIEPLQNLPLHRWQPAERALPLSRMDYQTENPSVIVSRLEQTANPATQTEWNQAREFVADIWPHASRTAHSIGISTQALVAQSALETGWGRHTMRFADGTNAFNLFGIKAGNGWNGNTISKPTKEYRDGVMQTEIARFRAYDSISQAFSDYADFVTSNPRYRLALDNQGSDTHYLRGLQQAGYATDPHYADKILSIVNGRTLQESIAALDQAPQSAWENSYA